MPLFDNVAFLPVGSGTADFVVGFAVQGALTPAQASVPDGMTGHYAARTADQLEWELGSYTYVAAGAIVQRTTVLSSSNANAKVNFSSSPVVAFDALAEDFSVEVIRKAPPGSTVAVATTDVEIGVDAAAGPVNVNLPSVSSWTTWNKHGLDLSILDIKGQAASNNITAVAAGTDVFLGGAAPVIIVAYGEIRLRPILDSPNAWYIRSTGGGTVVVAVDSVFGRTGTVIALTGDYSFSLISGTATSSQLPSFGTGAAGIVPASGGGTSNFLRADGTWNAPSIPAAQFTILSLYAQSGLGGL